MSDLNQVLVLAFDALDFKYLDKYKDKLPNFTSIRSDGVEAALESTVPPITPSAWPSMYTGVDPSRHGVSSFFTYNSYIDGDLATRNDVSSPALWNYLTTLDAPSVILNMPMTHPAETINGVVVPGYPAPETTAGTPIGIRNEISDEIGEEYRIYTEGETADDRETVLDSLCHAIDIRRRAAAYLLSEYEWRLGIIQIQKTDEVFHKFDDDDAHRRVYKAADEFLGAMRKLAGDAQIVICSDHGIGPKRGFNINVNSALYKGGYLETTTGTGTSALYKTKSKERLIADPSTESQSEAKHHTSILQSVVMKSANALDRVGIEPQYIKRVAKRIGAEPVIKRAAGDVTPDVDFEQSQAYCRYGPEWGIRLNLDGREPHGIVPKNQYESLQTDLIEYLSTITTPEGKPVFESVKRRDEVFNGPRTETSPDIILFPKDQHYVAGPSISSSILSPIDKHDHYQRGVFIGAGSAYTVTGDHDIRSLTDIAPLICSLLGIETPASMTGSDPTDLLDDVSPRREYGNVPFGTDTRGSSDSEKKEVTDRLEDLGYL